MQRKNYVINAVLKAVTTLNVNEPDTARKIGGANINVIPTAIVDGEVHSCIPGSSFRGALRRHAVEVLIQSLKAKYGDKPQFDLQQFYWHTIGGVRLSNDDAGNEFKGIAEVAPFTLVENVRRRNPLMSLFGTFDPAPISGHIQVANAICTTPQRVKQDDRYTTNVDRRSGVRADELRRSASVAEMLTPDAVDEWEASTAGARQAAALRRKIEDLTIQMRKAKKKSESTSAFEAEIKSLEKERETLIKESAGSSVSVQQLLGVTEYIPQGSEMNQRIRVMDTNDIEMGLLLATLRNFADRPLIGGKLNLGAGEVSVQWDIKDIQSRQVVAVVSAGIDDGFVVHDGHAYVTDCINAWEEFAASDALGIHYPTPSELKIAA